MQLKRFIFSFEFLFFYRELYLDGNDLRCFGVQDLIRVVSEESEKIAIQKEIEAKVKLEEQERLRREGMSYLY